MIPQGSALVNTAVFDNMISSIHACESCAQLQDAVNVSFESLNAIKAGIQLELASLTPIMALLSPPGANLGAIVSWITSFVSLTLTPLVKPTITYAAQLSEILAQVDSVTAAISAASAKFPSCSISVPTP